MAKEVTADFICKTLGEIFDEPCNYSVALGGVDYDFGLFMLDNACNWCEQHCNDRPDHAPAACWEKFFQVWRKIKRD